MSWFRMLAATKAFHYDLWVVYTTSISIFIWFSSSYVLQTNWPPIFLQIAHNVYPTTTKVDHWSMQIQSVDQWPIGSRSLDSSSTFQSHYIQYSNPIRWKKQSELTSMIIKIKKNKTVINLLIWILGCLNESHTFRSITDTTFILSLLHQNSRSRHRIKIDSIKISTYSAFKTIDLTFHLSSQLFNLNQIKSASRSSSRSQSQSDNFILRQTNLFEHKIDKAFLFKCYCVVFDLDLCVLIKVSFWLFYFNMLYAYIVDNNKY